MRLHNNCNCECTYDKVERILAKYFEGVEGDVQIEMRGTRPVLEVEYQDFKPTRKVRAEIEKLLPNVEFEVLRREYSDRTIAETYHELSLSAPFKYKGQNMTLYDLFDTYLYNRNIRRPEGEDDNYSTIGDREEPTPIPN